jgi:phospholipase C
MYDENDGFYDHVVAPTPPAESFGSDFQQRSGGGSYAARGCLNCLASLRLCPW